VPADARLSSVITLQNRTGVSIRFLYAAKSTKEIVDFVYLRLHKLVIIIAPRVTRDSAGSSITLRFGVFPLPIIKRQNNDRPRACQNLLRVTAFFFAALHVIHFSSRTFPQPVAKLVCMARDSAIGDTAGIESKLVRTRNDLFFQFLA